MVDMDTIQIEITNHCVRTCANCTRFVGHHYEPYFMDLGTFRNAVDSMRGYPKMVGFMGGEPLLHPRFEEFCDYALSKIPKERLGLWTALPKGFEKYAAVICRTFGNLFVNDHSRPDIYHQSMLVAASEALPNKHMMFVAADHCWVQNCWSASINPHGAFFCEVAAAWSILLNEAEYAWKVEPEWWGRSPKDFREQIEHFCPRCGGCLDLQLRSSWDEVDDISLSNLALLKGKSKRVDGGKYSLYDFSQVLPPLNQRPQMGNYKDLDYRNGISRPYGIFQIQNDNGFLTPYLMSEKEIPKEGLFEQYRRAYLQSLPAEAEPGPIVKEIRKKKMAKGKAKNG
jgi:hypothetical protein